VAGQSWLALQVVFGGALLVLAVAVVAKWVKPDQGLVALALVLVVVVLAALRPTDVRELVGRLTEAGPIKFAAKEAQTAADETAGVEADELDFQETMLDLRLKLEYKMTYIAKHLLGDVGRELVSSKANFVTVGSLQLDGLLSSEQARTATLILTWTDQDLARAAPQDRSAFLAAANELVSGIRATVFANMVRLELKRNGWSVSLDEARRKRRDLMAARTDDKELRIVPVFATAEPSEVLNTVMRRLAKDHKPGDAPYVFVIPDHSDTKTSDDPPVVRLSQLPATADAAVAN
jgi:hypothetical protein